MAEKFLNKLVELEEKFGINNTSVIGGLAKYLQGIDCALPNVKFNPVPKQTNNLKELKNVVPSFKSSSKFDSIEKILLLDKPIETVKYVGTTTGKRFRRLGVETLGDLLFHFPHRYLDFTKIKKVSNVKVEEEVTVVGIVKNIRKHIGRNGTRILSIGIFDGTGYVYGTWFNQNYIANKLKEGMQVAYSGKIVYRFGLMQIQNPLFDVIDERQAESVHTGRIIPIYPATQDLSPVLIRRIIKNLLTEFLDIPDYMPVELRKKLELSNISFSLQEIHFPSSKSNLEKAKKRMLFDELFLMQLGLAIKKKRFEKNVAGIKHVINEEKLNQFFKLLPFELTADQKRTTNDIVNDMASSRPMSRLLQGEVGSGKTVVALAVLLTTVFCGYQGAIMAPTEVLANQHFLKTKEILDKLNIVSANLTGSMPAKKKEELQEEIRKGNIDIVIGTHTLIQEKIEFKNLGAVVVDEQHRFGVEQRMKLKEKGACPDVLIMTATPIPRTLSLTLYGDLDVSIIKERPGGRDFSEHVETYICNNRHRKKAYEKVRSEVKQGRQTYIVCPLIEESDKLEVKAVMDEVVYLREKVFPDLRVDVIHGKLKSEEKNRVMERFREGKVDILISTTVIEVGIDVPNASVMLIENADRFGLSQLHQLRGRIGRGEHKSCCILFANLSTEESKARMKAIKEIKDGFKLAEVDLEIRGEGQLFGTRQSGLPDLKLAKLTRDIDVLLRARKEAFAIVEEDPDLSLPINKPLMRTVKQRFSKNLDWLFQN
ncbi:ATP-dependent DNA helicase RecG [Candidatus Oleimmundimicrobium sp.]|uniref:ATP-dependent DNA helicase RecG n=1 Tax=Candidatus Oleimmundimicrobium sp. TaxID=3060597 RepID=UPI002721CC24|nr:ATP-dependent DNA helicase RecG [Candidatus Oleimmundimicrobium sp.]MDO8885342.1 ATP-dependent DNA helicase RecG [Candidatus Oleimmundimicrobium sp.]